ncbi:MAG TPA: DUF1801 domain-containing protein [Planctomycetota bacterium]|nr:DUF1801 domain-containing protein [Planctomycetota bacterium]
MASSKAKTVDAYLKELPAERAAVVSTIRKLILKDLPAGYQEVMNWGMISYEVPLAVYPDTYNKQPLIYMALAAQKNYYALYAMCEYPVENKDSWLAEEFKKAGKKLDMGKCCIRFKSLDDIPLHTVGKLAARMPMEKYVAYMKEILAVPRRSRKPAGSKKASRKAAKV